MINKEALDMKHILRFEHGIFFLLTAYLYFVHYRFSWVLFLVLLFLPDISMIGYLVDNRVGAIIYNIAHSLILPCLLFVVGEFLSFNPFTLFSLVLFAHIFLDRALEFGLKFTDSFQHTHLNSK